jgi:LacI family transcriptional regulator
VVNRSGYVSEKTRQKVEKAIKELGYIPSAMARGLRLNRTYTFALILPDITNPFWTTVARGVEDTAQQREYSILLYNVDEDMHKQERALETVLSQQVDGVLIAPHDGLVSHLQPLRMRSVPTVIVDRRLNEVVPDWPVDIVRGDSISGAKALTTHLISLGHRKIAMVSGDERTTTAQDRVMGYRLALQEAGISCDENLIVYGEFRVSAGVEMTNHLMERGINFSAIFAGNNAIGMGVVRELIRRGIRIPEEIALAFYDDYANASEYFPFFTVVTQNAYQIGRTAAELLISRATGEHSEPREFILPSRLVTRYSCGSMLDDHHQSLLSLPIVNPKDLKESVWEVPPLLPYPA